MYFTIAGGPDWLPGTPLGPTRYQPNAANGVG